MIELVALDVAGTTVDEGGTVYRVLAETVRAIDADPTPDQIEQVMGAGKRDAIRVLLEASGLAAGADVVEPAYDDFRARLAAAYRTTPPRPFHGVPETLAALRRSGVRVALTTGFDRETTDALLRSLGWERGVVDAVACIDDVPAGRPAPYLVFRAMERTGVADVRAVMTAGDTVRDVEAGLNAGAAVVVAVTSGGIHAQTLRNAGAAHVLDSVTEIPALLADTGRAANPVPVVGS